MENEDFDNMNRKGKRKINEDTDQGNQIVVHKGSSSSYDQENESAPAANVSIPTTVAEDGVRPPPHLIQVTSSSRSQSSRTLYKCQFCSVQSEDLSWLHQHENRHRRERNPPQSQIQISNWILPTPFYNWYTTPTSRQFVQPGFGFAYGGIGCSRTGGFQPLNEFNQNPPAAQYGGDTRRRRLNTNLSLSIPQTSEPERNDGSIDLLSRVGASNSLENQEHDGDQDQDQDQDRNNQEDDGALDLSLKI